MLHLSLTRRHNVVHEGATRARVQFRRERHHGRKQRQELQAVVEAAPVRVRVEEEDDEAELDALLLLFRVPDDDDDERRRRRRRTKENMVTYEHA